jgi:hypothetical protein
MVCNTTARTEHVLRVEFQDGTVQEFILRVQRLYRERWLPALLIIGTITLTLAVYFLVNAPAAIAVFTILLTWSTLNFYVYNPGPVFADFPGHNRIIQGVLDGTRPIPPHFVYHVLNMGLVRTVPTLPLPAANFIVMMAANVFTALAVYALLRSRGNHAPETSWKWSLLYLAIPLLLYIGPINFDKPFTMLSAYVYPNTSYNPTVSVLKPFAIAAFTALVALLQPGTTRRRVIVAGMAVLIVFATLTKPSYTMPLLAVSGLVFAYSLIRPLPIKRWELIVGVMIPAVLVLGWQYLFTYGPQQSNLYNSDEKAQILFAPFDLYLVYWEVAAQDIPIHLIVSVIFPVGVYLLYFNSARRDISLNIAWLVFLAGQALAYIFVEAPGYASGNMTWSGRIALFVLFVVTLEFLIRQNRSALDQGRNGFHPRLYAGLLLLALHIAPNFINYFR